MAEQAAPRAPRDADALTESRLERLMKAGHFVVCGEMGPPQSADRAVIERKAAYFRGYVDAVNLTDC